MLAPSGQSERASYTCPMHPQGRAASPGDCPICGVALETTAPGSSGLPNRQSIDMTRQFWFGFAFALPVFVLAMRGRNPAITWIEFALSTPVVLWAALPFFGRAAVITVLVLLGQVLEMGARSDRRSDSSAARSRAERACASPAAKAKTFRRCPRTSAVSAGRVPRKHQMIPMHRL